MEFGSKSRGKRLVVSMGHSLAVLPGDGIGPEVTQEARRVLEKVAQLGRITFEVEEGLIGGAALDAMGDSFPQKTEQLVHDADATLLGAVGGPAWAGAATTPEQGLLRLRASLGCFANVRPFEVLPGLDEISPLRRPFPGGVIIRELLSGLYYGQPRGRDGDAAYDTARYSVGEIERLVRLGFQWARRQNTPLISVDKANVLETSRLWRQIATRIGREEFPDIPLHHLYVDAAAMEMALGPERFQVVVTGNLFGDILSDLTGGLVGSLGVLGSATLRTWGVGPGLYEPVHGSAPDIAGRGIANPIGAIWSCALLLEWSLGLREAGQMVKEAVRATVKEGVRTPDIGGNASTTDMADAVLRHL